MSYKAYQQTSNRTESLRLTEYRLLGETTRALIEIKTLDKYDIRKRALTLDRNRRVWSTFASDCANENNGLPDKTRAAIISLSLFVSRETSAVMRGESDVDALVSINRTIMQGLSSST